MSLGNAALNAQAGNARAWPRRYKMLLLLTLALLLCYIDRTLMSLAAITMQQEFGWSDSDKGLVMSTFFMGYLFMQFLGGLLANRYGGRNVFLVAVVLWSLFTVLTPFAAYISFAILLFARFMLGFGEGAAIPAAYNLVHAWMPENERSRSVSMFAAASSIGTVSALLVTGMLIEKFGWPFVFYLFGGMGLVWALFWVWQVPTLAEAPASEEGQQAAAAVAGERKPIPWKLLLSHPAVLTLYAVVICFSGISYTLASWMPSYFVDSFGVSVSQAGFYSILPWAVLGVVSMLAGHYADKQIGSGAAVLPLRKKLVAVGLLLVGASMLALTQADSILVAVAVICGTFAGLAIIVPGYATGPAELLPHHGEILYGFMAAIGSIASIAIVAATGFILDATDSYDMLWLAMAVTAVASILVFLLFAQASPIDLEETAEPARN
jgi:MFS transporter, ACS family, solute carrier family 17 (sodium-dependent inorganic phosphate cotransporter), other